MMQTPEQRLAQLERQVQELTHRVWSLEAANMKFGSAPPVPNMPTPMWPQTLPITCNTSKEIH